MTNRLLAPAPYARFQTSGGCYTADWKGVIAAAVIGDVIDLIRGGCTLLPAYFGGGKGTLLAEGSLDRQLGNPLAGNGADTADDVLASYTLPASSLDIFGRGLRITARGVTGPTSNDKRVKLWFDAKISAGAVIGGSIIADTGAWVNTLTPNNNVGWELTSNVFKLGDAGSDTQYAQGSALLGGIHGGIGLPVFPTAIETGAIVIALTGSSYAAAAANDLVAHWFEVSAMN
jgi:hypothetical protein